MNITSDNSSSLKNPFIEFTRFIAAIGIVLHHSGNEFHSGMFVGGYLLVEYFFLLSGYFTTKHFDVINCNWSSARRYAFKKYFSIAFYIIIAVIIEALLALIIGDLPMMESLLSIPFGIFPFTGTYMVRYILDFPLWFIGDLVLVLPLIIMLMVKNKDLYKNWLCYFAPIIIYSVLVTKHQGIVIWTDNFGTFISLLCRTVAGLCLGSAVYYISNKVECITCLKSEKRKAKSYKFIKWFGLGVWLIVDLIILLPDNFNSALPFYSNMPIPYIGLWFIALTCIVTVSETYRRNTIYNIVMHLGKLSMPIYCIHLVILKYIQCIFTDLTLWMKCMLAILGCLLCAEILLALKIIIRKISCKSAY